MALVLAFGVVLLISVSLSGVAARTVLSTALLFLVAGALIGPGGFGIVSISSDDSIVSLLADVALFTVLFTDGQRANLTALKENWSLSGRALGLGMPLTMIGIAVPAHFLVGLDWPTALLIGAILSPTDPVFAAALVGRSDIPLRLRRLLNVESGLNDGLALPFVLIFLATAQHEESDVATVAVELVLGLALGAGVAAAVALAWRTKILTAEPRLQPLGPVAIAVVVYAAATSPMPIRIWRLSPRVRFWPRSITWPPRSSSRSAICCRSSPNSPRCWCSARLITPERLSHLGWQGWLLAVVAILVVRPAAMLLSLLRTALPRSERLTAAWFGPKGFASVVYGLLVLQSGIPDGELVFDLVAVTIALSIVLHSSTDVPVARMLRIEPPDNLPAGLTDAEPRSATETTPMEKT